MASYTRASFPGAVIDVPVGKSGSPPGAAEPISLALSDGSTFQAFDSLSTGLKALNYLRTRGQYQVALSDDVTLLQCQSKGLLVENTLSNQRWLSQYDVSLNGNKLVCTHRSMSLQLSIEQALASVGFLRTTSGAAWNNNADLSAGANPPRVKCFDWNFSNTSTGSLLEDPDPLYLDLVS